MYIAISLVRFEIYAINLSLLLGKSILIEDLVREYFDYYKYIDYQCDSFVNVLMGDLYNGDNDIVIGLCCQTIGGFQVDFEYELETLFNLSLTRLLRQYGQVESINRYVLVLTDQNTERDYQHIDIIRWQATQ